MNKIEIEEKDDIMIIHVDGTLTSEYIYDIDKNFLSIIENLTGNKIKIIAIDFKNIYQVDSMGLGYLVKLLKHTVTKEIELILYDLNSSVIELMELSTLNRIFNIMSKGSFEYEYLDV